MLLLIYKRVGPAVIAIFLALLALTAVQVIEASEQPGVRGFAGVYMRAFNDMFRWLGGAPLDSTGPGQVLAALPTTLTLAGGALLLAMGLAVLSVAVEQRWPRNRAIRIPGQLLSMVSYLPAVVLGFLTFLFYSRFIEPGHSPVGHSKALSVEAKTILSIVLLGVGNGLYQDFVDGIRHDLKQILEADFLLAARSRGESILPYVIRALSIPLVVRAFSKLPVFIGAAIPFELLFKLPGVGVITFESIRYFLDFGNGTVYPVMILVIILGAIVTLSTLVADLLRFTLDPRQREEMDHEVS